MMNNNLCLVYVTQINIVRRQIVREKYNIFGYANKK